MTNKPNVDRTYGHLQFDTSDEAPHVIRPYTLYTDIYEDGVQQTWNLSARLPRYIYDTIGPADWERVARLIDTRKVPDDYSPAEFVIVSGSMKGATAQQVSDYLGNLMVENLYRVFCEKQIKLGNKAWLVPSSMQKVSKDGVH